MVLRAAKVNLGPALGGFGHLLQFARWNTLLTMTQLLERAFAEASKLPEPEQDAVASVFLAELESERRWTQAFVSSQDKLSQLADEALREFEAGETFPMNPERDFPNH